MNKIDSFTVLNEKGGRQTLSIFQKMVSQASKDNPYAMRGGLKYAVLADGSKCNRIDDDTFENIDTGEILKRVM